MVSAQWTDTPEDHDFPNAESYLALLVGPIEAAKLAKALRKNKALVHHPAKDLLRASQLALLPDTDPAVMSDIDKIKAGKKLSPVLLIQGVPLWVADGYHRICTSYHVDDKTPVPCRIVARKT